MVITGYKPCVQYNPEDSTVISQQKRLLKMKGKGEKLPRQQRDEDMSKRIVERRKEDNSIIWMEDSNGSIDDNDLNKLITKSRLYNIMGARHGPQAFKTHIKGLNAIDYFLDTADAI